MKKTKIEKLAFILVLLMIFLQGFYGLFSYVDPAGFSLVRGTELFSELDKQWVVIYGSRTIFITLVLGYLLYSRNYVVLMWCALFGLVMPVTDGLLAYTAQAPLKVVIKHIATIVFLLATFVVLKTVLKQKQADVA